MLVLTRKLDESIIIGENIVVKVVSVENGVVKLGIDAPKEVTILRNELLKDVKDMNIKASKDVEPKELDQLSKMLKK